MDLDMILKFLDKIPVWKTLKELPDKVKKLEDRIKNLEKIIENKATGKRCYKCKENKLFLNPQVSGLGKMQDRTWHCEGCGYSVKQSINQKTLTFDPNFPE